VVEKFAEDLAAAVKYALDPPNEAPISAAIYGGVPKEVPGIQEMVKGALFKYLDSCQDLPPGGGD
jgi:hypothetical protein